MLGSFRQRILGYRRLMKTKLTLLIGAGIGYVLGTRAGRERYDALVVKAKQAMNSEPAQEARAKVSEAVNEEAAKAREAVASAAASAAESAKSAVSSEDESHQDRPVGTP